MKKFQTSKNTAGIGCYYSYRRRNLVILPGNDEKSVQIYDSKEGEDTREIDVGEIPTILSANIHGEVFAFASENGTQIQVKYLKDGETYKSLTRGVKSIKITAIEFDLYAYRLAVCSEGETIHVFSLGSELALNGKSPEEVKESLLIVDESVNDKSTPASLLESRINNGTGLFGGFFGSSGEKSYLKLYIDCPHKSIAIHKNKLFVLTKEGKVHSIDIQTEGAFYDTNDKVKTIDLFEKVDQDAE